MDYLDIGFDISRIEERPVAIVWIGLFLMSVALFIDDLYPASSTGSRRVSLTAGLIGAAFLLTYWFWKNKLIFLKAGDEILVVLQDRKSKAILDEIDKFRKAKYLELLGKREYAEDEGNRQRLIAWLLEKRVINEQEAGVLLTDARTSRVDMGGNAVH